MLNIFKVNPEFMPPEIPSWRGTLAWIVSAMAIAFVAFVCLTAIYL